MTALVFAPLFFAATVTEDLAAGAKLTPADAAIIEGSPKASLPDRLRLLGWYHANPNPQHAGKRVALILALAGQGALGRLATHPAAAQISRQASPDGYAKVKAALLARAEKTRLAVDQSNAAWFIFPEEPDQAIGLTAENGLMVDTAMLAARYLLGTTDPDARSTAFGRSLLQLVKDTPDPLFQYAFADTLRAAGKIEWDYTPLANEAFARAAKAEPQQTNCGPNPAVSPLAESGPLSAGQVEFYALIGCSGFPVSLELLGGRPESAGAAKREIAARTFEVPIVGGQPRQSLQLVRAGAR
jgi:hypothetical protein